MDLAQPNIFKLMNQIDQKLTSKQKKAILLVGTTKNGKSSTFNWISDIPLKGVKERGTKVCYQIQNPSLPHAKITGGYTSCTIVPNILDCKGYNIIDVAGYEDKRNYVETICVAYSLKAILQAFEQVKFVIVLSAAAIYADSPVELSSTFNNFLSMFKMAQLAPQLKSKIYSSTSLLLTKCQVPESINQDVKICLKDLKDPNLDIKNKEIIYELLSYLLQKDKITYFKKAKLNQKAQKCTFIEKLSTKEWNFFNIKQAKTNQVVPKSIIQLPFNTLYQKLEPGQKDQIKKKISNRVSSYKEICLILRELIGDNTQANNIHQANLRQQQFVAKLSKFILNNDYYSCENLINKNQIKLYQQRPKKLNALKLILQLQSIITDLNILKNEILLNNSIKFMRSMANYRNIFIKMSQLLMRMYADCNETGVKLLKLKYILLRGIRQYEMLYDISIYHVGDVQKRINDALMDVFPHNKQIIKQNYLKSFKITQNQQLAFNINDQKPKIQNSVVKYLETKKDATQFQNFLNQYCKDNKDIIPEYYPLMRQAKLVLAKYSFQQKTYPSVNKFLFQSLEMQYLYEKHLLKTNKKDQNQSAFTLIMEKYYSYRLIILNTLKQTLVKTNKFIPAIEIAKQNRDIFAVCITYDQYLKEGLLSVQQRKNVLRQYAKYCFQHGRWKQSCILMEQLFGLQTDSLEKKTQINDELLQYSLLEQRSKQLYSNYLKGFAGFLKGYSAINARNQQLQALINRIKFNI